ncbi:LrgB family protein [Mangrovicoccus algicola]|uniref:LrgB family protein n=1 Tax=Mangrovicoccus algicola TaxID=2771008 RepID=A0A8J6YWX6_9RHOB|nr:LrgB family protein [Mangrovicoccus algicola]MBE3640683.1 LrgB family protein [Mangrovicoccus algicola]
MTDLPDLWAYLQQGALLWLVVTLAAYGIGDAAFRRAGRSPWVNPVLVAVVLVSAALVGTGTSYQTYFEGAQFVHFLLGPATVALAVPLFANLHRLRAAMVPMLAALVAGSVVAMVSAVGIGWLCGVRGAALVSLLPKSATSPVALGVAETIGGIPALTAAMVILTGIIGAVVVTPLYNAMGVRDWRARGFATGVAAHGIGTARAFQVNETAGAFAGIGMGLNALVTALLAPVVAHWLF